MAKRSREEDLTPSDLEKNNEWVAKEWVTDAQKRLLGFSSIRELALNFGELQKMLHLVRCGVIAVRTVTQFLNEDIDELFYQVTDLARQSHELMVSFASRCKSALKYIEDIKGYFRAGNIKAVKKFQNLKIIASKNESESIAMQDKFSSLSKSVKEVHRKARKNIGDVCGDKQKLRESQSQNDFLILRNRVNLSDATKKKNEAWEEKEVLEKKKEATANGTLTEFILNHVGSLSANIKGFLAKVEFKKMDPGLQDELLEKKKRALTEADEQTKTFADEVTMLTAKRRKVGEDIETLEIFCDVLQESTLLMDRLFANIQKMSKFWSHIKMCCTTVSEATEVELESAQQELKDACGEEPWRSNFLEFPEVQSSLEYVSSLWACLKEVCTVSEKYLSNVTDKLLSALEENLSPEEAESFMIQNIMT